jgi:hypothetical protein
MPPPTAAQSGKDSACGRPGPLALGPPPIETAENVCVCAQVRREPVEHLVPPAARRGEDYARLVDAAAHVGRHGRERLPRPRVGVHDRHLRPRLCGLRQRVSPVLQDRDLSRPCLPGSGSGGGGASPTVAQQPALAASAATSVVTTTTPSRSARIPASFRPSYTGGGRQAGYSTVTVLARLRGWSTLRPRRRAIR